MHMIFCKEPFYLESQNQSIVWLTIRFKLESRYGPCTFYSFTWTGSKGATHLNKHDTNKLSVPGGPSQSARGFPHNDVISGKDHVMESGDPLFTTSTDAGITPPGSCVWCSL